MGSQHTVYYVLGGTATGWQGVEGARMMILQNYDGLETRSGLFIINMIIKIIMIIFVIIIIWFRAHGRGESVLCLCADGKIRPGGSGRAALQTSEFQDKDTFITMFIVLS